MKQFQFIFLFILFFSPSNIGSQGQDLDKDTLNLGVKIGDSFSFNVSSNNGDNPNLYLVVLPQDVGADFEAPMPSQFSITVTDIIPNQHGEFCWSEGTLDSPCIYYYPRIEVSFASEDYNGKSSINLHIGGGVITTNNWERVDAYFAALEVNPDLTEFGESNYSIEEDGTQMVLNIETDYNSIDESIYGYSSIKLSQVLRYHKQTGVLQEERSTGQRGYADGTTVPIDTLILKTEYSSDGGELTEVNWFEFMMIVFILPAVLYRRQKK